MQTVAATLKQKHSFDFINGARGIAAIQVLLLHYCAFFFPAFARVQSEGHFQLEHILANSPLYFLIDGQNAVSIFFIMSGFVLTPAFSNASLSIGRNAIKRFVRLFLPVATSVAIAMILVVLLGDEHKAAADITGSSWAGMLTSMEPSFAQTAKEIFLNSMILGYQHVSFLSIFPEVNASLTPILQSPNSPMWTLHIELWGSILILLIVKLRAHLKTSIFWMALAGITAFLGSSRYNLFILGFVLYHHRDFLLGPSTNKRNLLGALLITAGVAISSSVSTALSDLMLVVFKAVTFTNQDNSAELKTEITATLIFIGIMMSCPTKKLMESRFAQAAGRLSFSLYLLHFPILFTISAFIFNSIYTILGYLPAVAISCSAGIITTVASATIFEKFVDQKSIRLSRAVSSKSHTQLHTKGLS